MKPCYVKPFKEFYMSFNFLKKNLNTFALGLKSVQKKIYNAHGGLSTSIKSKMKGFMVWEGYDQCWWVLWCESYWEARGAQGEVV